MSHNNIPSRLFDLSGKPALVTGAASGFGSEVSGKIVITPQA